MRWMQHLERAMIAALSVSKMRSINVATATFVMCQGPKVLALFLASGNLAQAGPPASNTGVLKLPDYQGWSVNPRAPGADVPAVGSSLFDQLTTHASGEREIAFPIMALLRNFSQRAQCLTGAGGNYTHCYRAVLIPLGRSLQRSAAEGDFFHYPRAVFAFTDDPASSPAAPLLKDRLYLGYHEKAQVIEVISYNDAAARFEFQIVSNYRAGAAPKVVYASRAVCTSCHQNAAPIFSRQVWDETNANPEIAKRLLATGRDFYGVRVDRGVDIPQAIDNAVARANRFAAYQTLWRLGCGDNGVESSACRIAVLRAALQYRLSGESGFDQSTVAWRTQFKTTFDANWQQHWPQGLYLPSAEIPNRDPLQHEAAWRFADVPAQFDALSPRLASNLWSRERAKRELIAGVAAFFSNADIAAVDSWLMRQRSRVKTTHLRARCRIDRQRSSAFFTCGNDATPFSLRWHLVRQRDNTWKGALQQARVANESVHNIALSTRTSGRRIFVLQLHHGSLSARTHSGERLQSLTLTPERDGQATATLDVREEFALLEQPLARLAQGLSGSVALQRSTTVSALLQHLNGTAQSATHPSSPAIRYEPVPHTPRPTRANTLSRDNALAGFYRYCAVCHESNERAPPGFLHPDASHAAQGVKHCAARIYYRLTMWQQAAPQKTPMPPRIALETLHPDAPSWSSSAALQKMRAFAASNLADFNEASLLAQPYETLPSCLPPIAPQKALR